MIRKMLDLSTSHLTKATADALWGGKRFATIAIEAGRKDPAFVLLHVPDEIVTDGRDWPNDLRHVAFHAFSLGCDFIKFDRDGEEVDGLSTYQW